MKKILNFNYFYPNLCQIFKNTACCFQIKKAAGCCFSEISDVNKSVNDKLHST